MPLNRESLIRVLRSTESTDPAGLTFGELAYVGGNGKLFMGTTAGESLWIGTGITTGGIATNSVTLVPTQSAVKTYVDAAIGGSVVNTFNGTSGAISLTGNGAILYSQSGGTNTISARLAGTGVTGVASFSNASFAVSAGGEVTIANDGVSNAQLANDSVTVTAGNGLAGGGAVALGATITLTNAGVTGVVAGTGIAVSGATGNVTITNTGVQTFNGSTAAISLTGNGAILYTQSAGTNTISARVATTSLTGVASFSGTSFVVTAGEVTIANDGVSNAQLVNDFVTVTAKETSTLALGNTLTLTGGSNITLSNTANTVTLGLANDIVIAGNLTVNGTVVTANVESFVVEDPLIALGTGNSNDTVDLGFYAQYMAGSNTGRLYTGLFRDASDAGKYKLFTGLTGNAEPTTTVNTGESGYTVATLVVGIDGGTF